MTPSAAARMSPRMGIGHWSGLDGGRRSVSRGVRERAVVIRLTVNGTDEAPLKVTVEAEGVQLACVGAPAHVRVMEPLKPLSGFTSRLNTAICPAVTVADSEPPLAASNEKLVPMPVKTITCGLPEALSVMVTEALRLPLAVGSNVTLIVQFAAAVTLAPQVLV